MDSAWLQCVVFVKLTSVYVEKKVTLQKLVIPNQFHKGHHIVKNKPKQRSTNQVTVGEVTCEVASPEQSPSSDFKYEEKYILFFLAGKTNPIIVTVNVDSQPIQ